MKTKTFTFKQLSEFINSQLDDRPVNMEQSYGDEDCGCILVHFGRHLSHRKIKDVGYNIINTDRSYVYMGDYDTRCFIDDVIDRKPQTYGEVKKYLTRF
jgi:hypothetical protein